MSDVWDIFKEIFAVINFTCNTVNFRAVFCIYLFIVITEGEGKLNDFVLHKLSSTSVFPVFFKIFSFANKRSEKF